MRARRISRIFRSAAAVRRLSALACRTSVSRAWASSSGERVLVRLDGGQHTVLPHLELGAADVVLGLLHRGLVARVGRRLLRLDTPDLLLEVLEFRRRSNAARI